jgi:Fe-S-cluster-containing dehydrogenase component
MSGPRYAMTLDTQRCVGCHACVFACQAENDLPEHGYRDWVKITTRGKFPNLTQVIHSERCHQCEHPPCVTACPTGASHINQGGTVLVTASKCTGCKACIAACPYDARYVHPEGYVDKCTFCLHRTSKGKLTACVENCPTKALDFGDLDNPKSSVSKHLSERPHEVLRPELGLRPKMFFLK